PVAGPRMVLPHRARVLPVNQAQLRPHSRRIARPALQPHPQSRFAADVVIEFGRRPVLRHYQVHPPVPIIIPHRAPPPFPIHLHPALLPGDRLESSLPHPPPPPPPPRHVAPPFPLHCEKVLAKQQLFLHTPNQL